MPIRTPTPLSELLAWHTARINGTEPPRVFDDEPQCGWFTVRFRKDGPLVPARIWMEQICEEDDPGRLAEPERLRAEVLGQSWDPVKLWTWKHPKPITKAEFLDLVHSHETDNRMAATHAAFDTSEKPTKPPRR